MNKCQPDDAIRKDLWLYTCYSTLIQKGPDAVLPEIRSHLAMLLVMLDSREDMAKVKKIYNEVQNLRADHKLIDERVSKEFKRLAREIGGLEKVIDELGRYKQWWEMLKEEASINSPLRIEMEATEHAHEIPT